MNWNCYGGWIGEQVAPGFATKKEEDHSKHWPVDSVGTVVCGARACGSGNRVAIRHLDVCARNASHGLSIGEAWILIAYCR